MTNHPIRQPDRVPHVSGSNLAPTTAHSLADHFWQLARDCSRWGLGEEASYWRAAAVTRRVEAVMESALRL